MSLLTQRLLTKLHLRVVLTLIAILLLSGLSLSISPSAFSFAQHVLSRHSEPRHTYSNINTAPLLRNTTTASIFDFSSDLFSTGLDLRRYMSSRTALLGTDFWTSNGPQGASITALVVDPSNPNILYAGTGQGVYKSSNGGASWTLMNSGPGTPVRTLAIDSITPTTVYAGTDYPHNTVFKSTNGGTNWNQIKSFDHLLLALAIDPSNSTTLYAGTSASVYKSTNGGANWSDISSNAPGAGSFAFEPNTPTTLYKGGYTRVFKSTNGGASWSSVSPILCPCWISVAIDPINPTTLYAVASSNLYKSTNGGTNWTSINNGLLVSTLTIDPSNSTNLYIGTQTGVYKSTNGGTSWNEFNTGLTNLDVRALAITPSGTSLHAGTYGGGVFDYQYSTTTVTPQLVALEVTQGIQDLNNSCCKFGNNLTSTLIQDKRTFVRAHVKSPQGDITQVSAKLIGARIEANNIATPLGELLPSNNGQFITVLQNPQRINLNDSFYFELPGAPQDWRRGTVELEFRGVSHNFQGCQPGSNSCKIRVTFEQATTPEMVMVGLAWKEITPFPPSTIKHEPTLNDLVRAKQQIEAQFPIPRLNASYVCPTFFGNSRPNTSDEFDRILKKLSQMRTLDGCIGPSCHRYYMGVLVDSADSGTFGKGALPGNVAAGYLNSSSGRLDSRFSIPHEFGHNAGRKHTFEDPSFMPPDGTINENNTSFFGFDIFEFPSNGIYGPTTPDLMNYDNRRWISPHTYKHIGDHFASLNGPSFAALAEIVHENAGLALMVGQPAAVISGSVTQGTGEIESIYVVDSPATAAAPNSGSYTIRFENVQGVQLASYNFEPDTLSEGAVKTFVLLLPLQANTTRAVLLYNGQVIASRSVSASVPTLNVTFPNGGESLTSATATFTWSASDLDGDSLSYVVQYSKDAGATWQTLASGLTSTTYEVNLNLLGGTNQGLLRVFASDGFLTAQDQSNGTFSVAKHSPQPSIQAPMNDHLYVGGQTIIFEGGAYDIEDGQLGNTALSWNSNLNGSLGTGRSLSVSAEALAEGTHAITLTAQDTDGQSGSATINIQVSRTRPTIPARLSLAPTDLSFLANFGGGPTPEQVIAVRNKGDGVINWSASANQSWIKLNFASGTTPANLPIIADPTGLAVGQYTGLITITSPGVIGSPQTVAVTLNVIAADVSVNQAASPNPAVVGSQLTYTITATNSGPNTASSVTVSDNLPSAVTFVSCIATDGGVCGGSGNNRMVTFSSLISGASATITLVAQANCSVTNGFTISNTATVSSTSSDPNSANNSATVVTTASNPTALSPTSLSFPASGGTGSVDVTTASNCSWTAISNATWLTITSSADGTGNGTVSYSIAANLGEQTRTGTITIAGNTFTATQAGGCPALTIAPPVLPSGILGVSYSQQLTQTGSTGTITWSTTGSLPDSVTLNTTTGLLSGTPINTGTFDFTVRATDGNGCFGERSYTVIINGTGLMFYPLLAPVRLLDTRGNAISPNACTVNGSQPIAGNTSLLQPARNFCGIPADAQAITGNITTVQSGGGYLTLYPSGAVRPTVANTNYGPNEIVNNVFTVGLGNADGAFDIYALNTTEVVVDVTGYYAPPGPGGLYFHPLPAPVRLLETRAGEPVGCVKPDAPLARGADSLQTATTACTGIPASARAIVGNATTVSPQGPGYLTLFPAEAARPLIASSNYDTNQIVNGPFTTGLSAAGQFKVFTLATTELVIDVLGYYSAEALDANGVGLLFTPLAQPVRWLETRAGEAVGCFKPGSPLNGNQSYLQVGRGLCDGQTIPAAALAVVGNATVVFPVTAGYLTLWPASGVQPTVATANYNSGEIVNRHFIVGLGSAEGAFKMFSYATTDLVIDLSGYFAP